MLIPEPIPLRSFSAKKLILFPRAHAISLHFEGLPAGSQSRMVLAQLLTGILSAKSCDRRQLQLPSPAIKSPNGLSEQRTCSRQPGYLFGAKEGAQPENHAKASPCPEAAPSFCEVYSGSQSPYLCQISQSPHFCYGE